MKIDFKNKSKIEDLRNTVREALCNAINDDFVLLDVPNHRNIGDLLIWQGELEFLKEIPFNMTYSSNIFTHKDEKIKENSVILLHGGGNFGDVWRLNQDFRNSIIKKFQRNRIIVFPQTIHYENKNFIEEDAELYNSHPDLTICARDNVSYKFAQKHFDRCKVLKLPDMAFFLDYQEHQVYEPTGRTLVLKRLDKELGSLNLIETTLEKLGGKTKVEIGDWPGFLESGTFKRRVQYYLIKGETILSKTLKDLPVLGQMVHDEHGLKGKDYKSKLIKKGVDFINQYDTIYSTRLHGFILSVLLNKEVNIFDNSYGKNRNFFETWLTEFENVKLLSE